MSTLANQGVPRAAENRYEPREVAGNHRLSNVAAALLCAQIERMDDLLAARRAVEDAYRTDLADAEVEWQDTADGAEPVPWLVTVLVEPDRRDAVIDAMAKDGVQARPCGRKSWSRSIWRSVLPEETGTTVSPMCSAPSWKPRPPVKRP